MPPERRTDMNLHDTVAGFTVLRKEPIEALSATLYEMSYRDLGTKLLYLEREEKNKTFSICFPTVPTDDTGVFHILEHSVLCGSEKYPVKEPFVELLKGSLQTFLNAFTFQDKTMYPVSSRNERDFLHLIDIYMDAVLHPLALKTPDIFRQEGWHYELGGDGKLSRTGVVYNEMKGAYSSADEIAARRICALLYPDTCYAKESGGDPDAIPSLTYDAFCKAHRDFYHPSGAFLFLDGEMPVGTVLQKLDSHLKSYTPHPVAHEIREQTPTGARREALYYEVGEGEKKANKARLTLAVNVARFDETEKLLGYRLITDALAATNDAPLKKALLADGLCEDCSFYINTGIRQAALVLDIINTKKGNVAKIKKKVRNVLSDAVKNGIDRETLTADLNRLEFNLREADTGSEPRGVGMAIDVMDTWLYGGDPAVPLRILDCIAPLREKLATRYYEDLLAAALASEHRAELLLLPSKTLAASRRKAEEKDLEKVRKSLTGRDIDRLTEENAALRRRQSTPDSPEALASLPTLTLDDIPKKEPPTPTAVSEEQGARVIFHDLPTRGITYVDLWFALPDLKKEEALTLALLGDLLKNFPTKRHTPLALQSDIKRDLGALSVSAVAVTNVRNFDTTPYLRVTASALDHNRDRMIDLAGELLLTTDFSDGRILSDLLAQCISEDVAYFRAAGHALALTRTLASVSPDAVFNEYTAGYTGYCRLREYEAKFPEQGARLAADLAALLSRAVCRRRLTFSMTGAPDPAFVSRFLSAFPEGETPTPVSDFSPIPGENCGYVLPSRVSYAATASAFPGGFDAFSGSMFVAQNLLNYTYLWDNVRVRGGAYGAGFAVRPSGVFSFYSYRDPCPSASLACFAKAGDALRAFCAGDEDLTRFIIGAYGEHDPLTNPRMRGAGSTLNLLRGIRPEDTDRIREELLSAKKSDLLRIADLLDTAMKTGTSAVAGEKSAVEVVGSLKIFTV